MKYLGETEGMDCHTSENAANDSVLITGQSGSGKTARMNLMEMASAVSGDTVIVLDVSRTHAGGQIFPLIKDAYEKLTNRMDAVSGGRISILPEKNVDKASADSLVCANISALASAVRLSLKQTGVLREAMSYAMENREQPGGDIQAVETALKQQGDTGKEAAEKLWQVFHCGIFGKGKADFMPGHINIIDLSGVDMHIRKTAAEILLSFIWHQAGILNKGNTAVYIDEVQNLDIGVNSMTAKFLCEGRRFGISMVLATQTLEIFDKKKQAVLGQAATRLYFHPAQDEAGRIAGQIRREQRREWEKRLNGLKKGECIAAGCIEANGVQINRPYLLR